MTARNFERQFFGGACMDQRCKRDFCAREQDKIKNPSAAPPQETIRLSPKAQEALKKLVRKMPRIAGRPSRNSK
jgi:hypothetical protein